MTEFTEIKRLFGITDDNGFSLEETDPEKFNMGDETQIVDLFCIVLAKILLGVEVSEIQDF